MSYLNTIGTFILDYFNIFAIILAIVAIGLIIIKSKAHSKKQEEIKQRFLEEEEAANAVRKKEIDEHLFYVADLSVLPKLPENDDCQVQRCADRTMIKFAQPVTNLELKKQYGPSQMDIIAQYEENFNEYLKALTKWAKSIAEETPNDALRILDTVVHLGGEFQDTYKLAADIFASRGDKNKLGILLSDVEKNYFRDPTIKQRIINYINTKKEEIA